MRAKMLACLFMLPLVNVGAVAREFLGLSPPAWAAANGTKSAKNPEPKQGADVVG